MILTDMIFSQMKSPGLTTSIDGKNKTLYMQSIQSIEAATRPNLKKTLKGNFHIIFKNLHSILLSS